MNGQFPLGDINPIKYFYLVSAVTGLLFALVSQSENTRFVVHLLVWQLQAFVPITCIILTHHFFTKFILFNQLNVWVQLFGSGLVGSLVFVPIALAIDIYVVGEGWPANLLAELKDEVFGVTPPVTIFWMLINAPWIMGYQYRRAASTPSANHLIANQAPFLKLTSLEDHHELISISAQLHYLEIVSENKKFLILYSLAAAIDELPDDLGIQIHRSHWIAKSKLARIRKTGRTGVAVMSNGRELPISRSRLKDVVELFNAPAESALS
jgi:hypothetical protein